MNTYNKLIEYKTKFPELTFDNKGYQYVNSEIKEKYKKEISEIEDLLKKEINGLVSFDNFKPRENGSFDVRVQYYWDNSFQGVGYFNIEDFK